MNGASRSNKMLTVLHILFVVGARSARGEHTSRSSSYNIGGIVFTSFGTVVFILEAVLGN